MSFSPVVYLIQEEYTLGELGPASKYIFSPNLTRNLELHTTLRRVPLFHVPTTIALQVSNPKTRQKQNGALR